MLGVVIHMYCFGTAAALRRPLELVHVHVVPLAERARDIRASGTDGGPLVCSAWASRCGMLGVGNVEGGSLGCLYERTVERCVLVGFAKRDKEIRGSVATISQISQTNTAQTSRAQRDIATTDL